MLPLLTYFWEIVTEDSVMQDLFNGEVELYYSRSLPEEDRPYIVYHEELRVMPPWGILRGNIVFDIVDYDENAERAFQIRDRLVALLEKRYYDRVPGYTGVRCSLETEINLTERDMNVWRRVLTFRFRAIAARDIEAVLNR